MNAEPVKRELTEDEYENVLNDSYGEVFICGTAFKSGYAIRRLDPAAFRLAFRCGKIDYEGTLEPNLWKCGKCGEIYEHENEAEFCCQEED